MECGRRYSRVSGVLVVDGGSYLATPRGRAFFVLYTRHGRDGPSFSKPVMLCLSRCGPPHVTCTAPAIHVLTPSTANPRLGPTLGLMRSIGRTCGGNLSRRISLSGAPLENMCYDFWMPVPTLARWTPNMGRDTWPTNPPCGAGRPLCFHTRPCTSFRLSMWLYPSNRLTVNQNLSEHPNPRRYKYPSRPPFVSSPSSAFARERLPPPLAHRAHVTPTRPRPPYNPHLSWSLSTDAHSCAARSAYSAETTIVASPAPLMHVGGPLYSVPQAPSPTGTSTRLSRQRFPYLRKESGPRLHRRPRVLRSGS